MVLDQTQTNKGVDKQNVGDIIRDVQGGFEMKSKKVFLERLVLSTAEKPVFRVVKTVNLLNPAVGTILNKGEAEILISSRHVNVEIVAAKEVR